MPNFTTAGQLEKYIVNGIRVAVADTQDVVKRRMDVNLKKFYTEYIPTSYERLGLLSDATHPNPIVNIGNGAIASVEYRDDGMNYPRGEWSGQKVFYNAMLGSAPHGGVVDAGGTPIWINVEKEMDVAVPRYIKRALNSAGIPV